jgi:hypothetical protein
LAVLGNFTLQATRRFGAKSEKWLACAASATPTQILTSPYDAVGNLTCAQDMQRVYSIAYDALDRVTQHNEPLGFALTMGYDNVVDRTSVAGKQSSVVTSIYGPAARLSSKALNDSAPLRGVPIISPVDDVGFGVSPGPSRRPPADNKP